MLPAHTGKYHNAEEIVAYLKAISNPAHLQGMRKFGIDSTYALGVTIPQLRAVAKQVKTNHPLALQLWKTGIHEARILASMIDDPALVTGKQIDSWVKDFNSWDLCDQVCGNLFDRTAHVMDKVAKFSTSKKEFIKRAAFTIMAGYAVHNKTAPDKVFTGWLTIIEREAGDERNFVSKAINWALRGIGKRNKALNTEALKTAKSILIQNTRAAKWVAANAIRELESEAVGKKLSSRGS